AIADDVRVADDGAGEITGPQAVDRIRVPDAADVEPVAHVAHELLARDRIGAFHDDVRRGDAGLVVELTAPAVAESEAGARAPPSFGHGSLGAELGQEPGIAEP